MTRRQWTGLAGILFAALMLAGMFSSGTTPDSDGSDAAKRYAEYWSDSGHQDKGWIGALLSTYSAVALLCFAGGLRALLRGADAAVAGIVRSAGTAAAVLFGVGICLVNGPGIAGADTTGLVPDGSTAILLEEVGYPVMSIAVMMAGAMAVAFGLANRQARVVPQWILVLSGLLALAGLGSFYTAWLGFMLLPLWSVVVGVLLLATRGAGDLTDPT